MTYPKIFSALCWDECCQDWIVQKVFLSKKDAVTFAYDATQTAVRCNRDFEWWRVEEHALTPCSGVGVVWGCPAAIAGGVC